MERWNLAKVVLIAAAVYSLLFIAGGALLWNHVVYAQDRAWETQKAAPKALEKPHSGTVESWKWGASPKVEEKALGVRTELRHRIEISGINIPNMRLTSPLAAHVDVIEYSEASSSLVRNLPGLVSIDKFSLSGLLPVPRDAVQWFDMIRQGQTERRSGVIVLMDRQGADVQRYLFNNAWPSDLSVDLAAGSWTLSIVCENLRFESP